MGLDMYLRGEKFHWTDWENKENNLKQDGFKVTRTELELGYWRKHPDLHGYIVKQFAGGTDEGQDIELSLGDLAQIIKAVKDKELPHTEGFFFGSSDGSESDETIKILEAAVTWTKTEEKGISRSVSYKASW